MSLALFTSPSLSNAATPKPHASPRAKPAPTATPSPAPGSVVGLLTWQYNQYVGSRPDVGATACLIPEPARKVAAEDAGRIMLEMRYGGDTLKKYGWVCGQADGSGSVNLDSVPVGKYSAFVISEKTTRNFKAPLRDTQIAVLGIYFDPAALDIITARPSRLLLYNWAFPPGTVEVRSGAVSHFSYDFGNTFI